MQILKKKKTSAYYIRNIIEPIPKTGKLYVYDNNYDKCIYHFLELVNNAVSF